MKLLKLFFSIFFIFLINSMNAQNIEYYYDNAGNRTERVIVMQSPSFAPKAPGDATPIEDVVGDYAVKIYPNPTKGLLAVEIVNSPMQPEGDMFLFDNGGRMLENTSISSSYTTFDLSSRAAGIYILRIRLNGETIHWKIIKE